MKRLAPTLLLLALLGCALPPVQEPEPAAFTDWDCLRLYQECGGSVR
jgi:hypothetical protein